MIDYQELQTVDAALTTLQQFLPKIRPVVRRSHPQCQMEGSQHGEDAILAKLLPMDSGTYVDVGAWHPYEGSNTWKFYQRGWSGVLVEPAPPAWYRLKKHRRRDHLVMQAAGNEFGYAPLRYDQSQSSIDPEWPIPDASAINIWCEVEPLWHILLDFPDVRSNCRLCSVDTEGAEQQVLEGIDWNTFRPDVFCVEFREYRTNRDLSERFMGLLEDRGYREVDRTNFNIIFQYRVGT